MAKLVTQTMFVGEITEEMQTNGWKRTIPIKVLPNNNTPATHFIEIWRHYASTYNHISHNFQITPIGLLDIILNLSISNCAKTIAIFKIHPKQNNQQ